MQAVLANWHLMIDGLLVTVQLAIQVIIFGSLVGLFGGLGILHGSAPIRGVLRAYVDIVRGTPLLVTIFIIYYITPTLGLPMAPFTAAVLALSFFAGAHMTEVVRGAVGSIARGQTEAGMSIGLTFWQRMRHVILPQAMRRAVPPWVNLCVELIKGTSLASLVSVTDLLLSGQEILERTGQPIPFYIFLALVYFVMCYGVARLGGQLERRFAYYD